MNMSDRVKRLRDQSVSTRPFLTVERAKLVTEMEKSCDPHLPYPVRRALIFQHIMANKALYLGADDLIVGERGPSPKATPTYPELCCHSLDDLDILNSREKVPFRVDEETKAYYREEVIPFWRGRTIRDTLFQRMTDDWKKAYQAGIFTEFMEQRAPGHTVLGDKIYRKGFSQILDDIKKSRAALDFQNDPAAEAKSHELEAMAISAEALMTFARRYAEKARRLADETEDPARQKELLAIAEVCSRVPAQPPRTFHEALQYYWFVHIGVISELNTWDSFNPGRLDQHLQPFYERGLADGSLTREKAEELLQCLWVKFNNQPAPPKVGVTAAESGTYTDFALINTGGLKADGSDGVNDMTYLILDVIETMRLVQPSSCLQVSKKNPDRFLKRAARIIRTGFGQPSIFNTDVIHKELLRQGKDLIDARLGGASGCVEVGAFGKENYNLTGYLNMPKIFEVALHQGVDPRSGETIGAATENPCAMSSFDALMDAYETQLRHFVDVKIRGNHAIERLYAEIMPSPFMSILIDDCIARGKDYHDGGARYNTSYIMGVGLGSITDMAVAFQHHVFDKQDVSMPELLAALDEDFQGREKLRLILLNKTPKYGNDDDYADQVMRRFFEAYFQAVDGRSNTKGGTYHINLLPTTVHVYFGSVIGATADGRKAGTPLSEGVSPVQGADRNGPTSVIKSVAKMDHARTGGTLLNQKLTPQILDSVEGVNKFVSLVRSYFRLDGHHIQFNVVARETLIAAKKAPEKYRDLIVRVAGYSDYFCDLNEGLQNEIIERTEHQDV